MANEQIVITANNSSLPEVGGDVAIYYDDVLDYESLGEKIFEVINLSEEKRKEKIEKGLEQVKKFTWEKCTKELLDKILCIKKQGALQIMSYKIGIDFTYIIEDEVSGIRKYGEEILERNFKIK